MPEGIEVLEYYKFIKPLLLSKKITNIDILSGKYQRKLPENWDILQERLPGKVNEIVVKGKTIFIKFDTNIYLSFTHGMSGWWEYNVKDKHSRIVFEIGVNEKVYYNDTRNFGRMTIYINENEYKNAVNYLGPSVLDTYLTCEEFYSRIDKKPKSKIGSVLLDQKLIAGIGNYMRCDILWYAKLHYTRTVASLNEKERLDLYNAVKNVCEHYLNYDEENDNNYCFIYYKDIDQYGNKIKRKRWLGRTIHYVEWN